MTPLLWTVAVVGYLVFACVTFALFEYADAARDLPDAPVQNAIASLLWPVVLGSLVALVVLLNLGRVLAVPFRAVRRVARAAGERARKGARDA